jgi:DNA-binding NtrC family response regulator
MSTRTAFPLNPASGKPKTASVTVFHVGPQDQDLRVLEDILDRSDWHMCPGTQWTLAATDDLASAVAGVQARGVPILLCDRQCASCTWQDVLDSVGAFAAPPLVIVVSSTADERLWAEALNLGAYDVLSKPYQPAEVVRVLSLALLHWENRPAIAMAQAS